MSLDMFDQLRRQCPDIEVGKGASSLEIEEAQQRLGVNFSKTYAKFLSLYGWAKIKDAYVYGLGPGIPAYLDVVNTAIDERQALKPSMPSHLLPLMNDGAGNHYCLDTGQVTEGEMPVVFWDHENPDGESQVPVKVSPSFGEWLLEKTKFLLE